MSAAHFTPYDGWEADVLEVARLLDHHDSPPRQLGPQPAHRGSTMRVLKAFEPPKCGAILQHEEWVPVQHNHPFRNIICGLPRGHHPYMPYGNNPWCGYGADDKSDPCGGSLTDLIHSNGHIPEVADELWK